MHALACALPLFLHLVILLLKLYRHHLLHRGEEDLADMMTYPSR